MEEKILHGVRLDKFQSIHLGHKFGASHGIPKSKGKNLQENYLALRKLKVNM